MSERHRDKNWKCRLFGHQWGINDYGHAKGTAHEYWIRRFCWRCGAKRIKTVRLRELVTAWAYDKQNRA